MDRLPEPLVTFREFVEADLRRAARLIIQHQCEIDPQIRIATPDGDYHLAVTLPADDGERRRLMLRISTFMAWKRAASFIWASELVEPDAVYALGVSRGEVHGCLARIQRAPRPWTATSFGAVEWLDRRLIGDDMIDLLPPVAMPMTPKMIASLEPWFGTTGKFPAVHVPSGEVRGV